MFFVSNGFAIDDSAINDCDIDDCVLDNVVVERQSLKADKEKKHVVKKYGLTILISVLIHLILFFFLSSIATKPLQKSVTDRQKAIRSYLYKKPVTIEKPKPLIAKVIEKKVIQQPKQAQVSKENEQAVKTLAEVKEVKVKKRLNSASLSVQKARQTSEKNTKAPVSFSAYKQLDKLRNSINDRIVSEELSQLQQFRSPSVMHGEQIPVPHSEKQLTPAQEREKNTTKMSDSISITKYDNGVCTIEREQFLGSPVEGSSSTFNCGESKFDKSFREHMKKVQEKLKPVKN